MRPALILAAGLALATSARPARAELWASSLGELMEHATRIEVIDVARVTGQSFDGTIVTPVRSASAAGAAVHLDVGSLPMPAKGDRVLVVCDSECPRAIGVEHAGSYRLIAQEPRDGAFVTPNLVERRSLELLAAGKPAPDLCIRGIVELLDETARPGFEVRVRASDGKGRGKLAGRAVTAALGVVWFASHAGTLSLELAGKAGITLVAPDAGRDKDGCYSAAFLPSQPLARSRAGLGRALDRDTSDTADRAPTPTVIGRATLTVPPGAPVPAGAHVLTLAVTSDGYLVLASDLAEGAVSRVSHDAATFGVGFPTKHGAPNDPELDLDFAVPSVDGYEHGAAVAKALRQGAKVTVRWSQHGKDTQLGTVTFAYVPEH